MNDIINFISTVGFPIGSCLLCMYYIYKDKNGNDKYYNQLIYSDINRRRWYG